MSLGLVHRDSSFTNLRSKGGVFDVLTARQLTSGSGSGTGPTGPTGPSGTSGPTGPSGGPTGSAGSTGPTGPSGTNGTSGPTGPTGPSGGGGGGSPGGSDQQIQFNNSGAFGGAGAFLYNSVSGNVSLGASPSYGGGEGVVFLANASVVPTSIPTGGGILYVSGGNLTFINSSGVQTVIA